MTRSRTRIVGTGCRDGPRTVHTVLARSVAVGALLLSGACSSRDKPELKGEPVQPAASRSKPELSTPETQAASESLMAVRLADGKDLVLGTQGQRVWGARLTSTGLDIHWSVPAPGILQRATSGIVDQREWVVLAFGRGRGRLDAPLSVKLVEPNTGEERLLAQWPSPRADFAHLSVSDLDSDGSNEIVYAAFESKYHVREWTHPIPGERRSGALTRMATARAFADLDGDGSTDRIVGRIYGDDLGASGDLKIETATQSTEPKIVGGIRSLAVAHTQGDRRPTLYVADGWSSSYAKEGRALLKRVSFDGKRFRIDDCVESDDEYTFNRIEVLGRPPSQQLIVYGNRRLSWVEVGSDGRCELHAVPGTEGQTMRVFVGSGSTAALLSPGSPTLVEKRTIPLRTASDSAQVPSEPTHDP